MSWRRTSHRRAYGTAFPVETDPTLTSSQRGRRRHAGLGTTIDDDDDGNDPVAGRSGQAPMGIRSLPLHASRAGAGLEDMVTAPSAFVPATFVSSRRKRAVMDTRTAADFMDSGERAALKSCAGRPLAVSAQYDITRGVNDPRTIVGRDGDTDDDGSIMRALSQALGGKGGSGYVDAGGAMMERKGKQLLRSLGWQPGRGMGVREVKVPGEAGMSTTVSRETMHRQRRTVVLTGRVEDVPTYEPTSRSESNRQGLGYGDAAFGTVISMKSSGKSARDSSVPGAYALPEHLHGGGGSGFGGRQYIQDGPTGAEIAEDNEEEDDIYGDGVSRQIFASRLLTSSRGNEHVARRQLQARGKYSSERTEHGSALTLFAARPKIAPLVDAVESTELVTACETANMRVSSIVDLVKETVHYDIPRDYDGRHIFVKGKAAERGPSNEPSSAAPPAVPPPRSAAVRRAADTLAAFVARNGPDFESIARERNLTDQAFVFLRGGEGAAYYRYKLYMFKAQLEEIAAKARAVLPAPLISGAVVGGGDARADDGNTLQRRAEIMRDYLDPSARAKSVLQKNTTQSFSQPQLVASSSDAVPAAFTLSDRFGAAGSGDAVSSAKPSLQAPQHEVPRQEGGRTINSWEPARLLCKRMGVPQPKVVLDPRISSVSGRHQTQQLLSGMEQWAPQLQQQQSHPTGEPSFGHDGVGSLFQSGGNEQRQQHLLLPLHDSIDGLQERLPISFSIGDPPPPKRDEVDKFILEAIFASDDDDNK